MNQWPRRNLLRVTAGAAVAVPMAMLGGAVADAASPGTAADSRRPAPDVPDVQGPVMFCVHDAQRGEVSILHGTDEVIVRDRDLVARVLRAAASHPATADLKA